VTQIDPTTPHRPAPKVHVTDNRGSSTAWIVAALVAVVAIIRAMRLV
jgi:hypothetical protein